MNEPTKTPSTPTPIPYIFDADKARKKIQAITDAALIYAGKDNHNPYDWLRDNVGPLKLAAGDKSKQTKELFDSIMALPEKPDTRVDKTVPNKPVENVPAAFVKP